MAGRGPAERDFFDPLRLNLIEQVVAESDKSGDVTLDQTMIE